MTATPQTGDGLADSAPNPGLSEAEAARRLAAEGPNTLPHGHRRGLWRILREVFSEPLIDLLVLAALLYLVLGELRDGLLLVASVLVIIGIDLYQGRQTERALEALRAISEPLVRVVRDGRRALRPMHEVVRGDLLFIAEGDRIAADGAVLAESDLSVDESLLTGESVPVSKAPWDGRARIGRPGGDGQPFVFAQTLAVRGHAYVEVLRTGSHTEVSAVASALASVETEAPILQRQTRRLVVTMAIFATVLTAGIALSEGLTGGGWSQGLLAGIATAIALLPEEFPVVITVYTALGARRMAQRRALTRRFGAISTLGAVTVLCTDKTGTLTMNRMTVQGLAVPGGGMVRLPAGRELSPAERDLLSVAALASEAEPADPMEVAIHAALGASGAAPGERGRRLERRIPLTRDRLMVTQFWRTGDGRERLVAVKGAPEAVFDACALAPPERAVWEGEVDAMARAGLRVLGAARATADPEPEVPELPGSPLRLVGLIGLADPLRPGVPEAIESCRQAGIRVVLLTGDHPTTARSIARQAGLARSDEVLTGEDLAEMDPLVLRRRAEDVDVYARITPEQKLRLVQSLKADGEIVAMTGDGVNDAPALKAAHVGVAMGQRGTEVAREAAAIVLMDDAFPTMVEAIRTGRRIFTNMRKAYAYLIAVHVAIAGMAALPILAGLPILLYPVEIVFLEFIIDPASSLAFESEPEETDVMLRPPRDPQEPLFNRGALGLSVAQGVAALSMAFAVYSVALATGHGGVDARSLGFATLVVANLCLILANRSHSEPVWRTARRPNPILLALLAGAVGLLLAALYVPALQVTFGFAPPVPLELAVAAGAGALGALWAEPVKWALARSGRGHRSAGPPGSVTRVG